MICHPYQSIFVHIPKCGGKSIEQVFLDALGLSWQNPEPLLIRKNSNPQLGPPRLSHLTAQQYVDCQYVSANQFASYFTFSVVRNPWDRAVSFYKYLAFGRHLGRCHVLSFKKFLMADLGGRLWKENYWFVRPQHEFILDASGQSMVDFIGRFEDLQTALDVICEKVGLSAKPIPNINYSKKYWPTLDLTPRGLWDYILRRLAHKITPPFGPYEQYYDEESKEYVASLYGKDIELFHYTFSR